MLERAASVFARADGLVPRRAPAPAKPARAAAPRCACGRCDPAGRRPRSLSLLRPRSACSGAGLPLSRAGGDGRLASPSAKRSHRQTQGRLISKCLLPRAGQSLGIELELLASESYSRNLLASLVAGEYPLWAGRRSWRYHAEIEVEYAADPAAETDNL
jgi:hypothetical protein